MTTNIDDSRDQFGSTAEPFFDAWNPSGSSSKGSLLDHNETLERPAAPARKPLLTDETMARLLSIDETMAGPVPPSARDGFTIADPPEPARPQPRRPAVDRLATLDTSEPDRGDRPVVFPRLGEAIGGFRLVSELGRGAFARVYVAHEIALGNRPVALKVSKAEGDEPQLLARLQHANIVPINSLHDDPKTGLRLICMPYLGGANLAQVLEAAGARATAQTQGRSLVDVLDLIGHPVVSERPAQASRIGARRATIPTIVPDGACRVDAGPHPSRGVTVHRSLLKRIPFWPRTRTPASSVAGEVAVPPAEENQAQPARQFLCESSYIRASAWIMARLAEGLDHAHSRGLLHRDLKPPNILIAADGTPMLLDFNLAAESAEPGDDEGEKAKMGGTLPYMAPEHLDAFNPRGTTPPEAVDERSDIYALGLILFEMIAGRHAFPDPPPGLPLLDLLAYLTAERRRAAPSLRAATPEVPWGLDAIVAKCLAPDPANRYRSAREFAEDLRRFLDDQPLKYTADPSVRERVIKWSRRHPRASSAWTIGPVAAAIVLIVGTIAWGQATHLRQVAARLNLRRFHDAFNECQFLLNTSSGGDLTVHLRRGVDQAKVAIDRYQVARKDWEKSYWVATLSPSERTALRRDLAELILLEARARVVLAEKEGTEIDRRKALERAVVSLDRAEALDPAPSPALFSDRAQYYHALGRAELARKDRERAETTPASSCRDDYLLGTADLAARRFDRAEGRLARAVALDPGRFWAWFTLGLCHSDQGRYADAVGDFNVCTVLMPHFAWPFANRGHALARSGRLDEALASYDRAVSLSPDFPDALAGRGLLHLESNRPTEAARDLARAIELGYRDLNVRVGLAEAMAKLKHLDRALTIYAGLIAERPDLARLRALRGLIRLGSDPDAARSDFDDALKLDPKLALAHLGVARLLYRSNPAGALDEATAAVAYDPASYDAIQLRALIHARLGRREAIGDVDRLIQAPTPHRLYNAACAMAVLSANLPDPRHEARALELLRRAIETGFPPADARSDADFKPFHARTDFRKLVGMATTPK